MPHRLLARAASRATGRLGWARAAIGALLGIACAALAGHLIPGEGAGALPWLLAPLGASAVLLFAVPASPLAQPWPVFGGSMLSALTGLATAHVIAAAPLACAVALALAIAAMSLTRSLHPPVGACALLGPLGAPLLAAHGWSGLLLPLCLNLLALLGAGWIYNNLTGHPWPHRVPRVPPAPPRDWPGSYEPSDLDSVLDEWDEVLDVGRDDLDALFRAVERRVQRRWLRENPQE